MFVLSVNMKVAKVYQRESVLDAIEVTWRDLPADSVDLTLQLVPVNETAHNTTETPTIYPSWFRLTNTSPGTGTQSFVITGNELSGLYQLHVFLFGTSRRTFRVSMEGHTFLAISSRMDVPSVPALRDAVFSFDGTFVVVSFDSPTDRGGYRSNFPCGALLAFNGSATAACQWNDDAVVFVYPKYTSINADAAVSVGSNFAAVPGQVRAYCDILLHASCVAWATADAASIKVAAPATPTRPLAVLTLPPAISSCNSLAFDVSSSAGAAGRPWRRAHFEVSAEGDRYNSAASILQAYLNANASTTGPFVVPANVLQAGRNYTIQVTLCNFLLACDFAARQVAVSSTEALVPIVTVFGPNPRTTTRSTALALSATAVTQSCEGTSSLANLQYRWSVRDITVPANITVLRLDSVSQNPALFKLTPYTLAANRQYDVILTVASHLSGITSDAIVRVIVKTAELTAKIDAGLIKYVAVGQLISLDASSSVDGDVSGRTGAAAGLLFGWSCVQKLPIFSPNCTVVLSPTTRNASVITVSTADATVNATNRVTVTVYDASLTRSSSSYTDIVVTSSEVPVLLISTRLTSVNTDKSIALLGSVHTSVGCNAEWTVDDTDLKLSTVALTDTFKPVLGITSFSTETTAVNLVLPAGVLSPRTSYTFSLSCGAARTAIQVNTNGAPLPGEFKVLPLRGQELSTVFQFRALQWADSDIPVTYVFGFTSSASGTTQVLSASSEIAHTSSTLPAGPASSGFASNCTLQVLDSLSASVTVSEMVIVSQGAETTTQRQQQVLALLEQSTSSTAVQDPAAVTNLISVASAVLNSANCSAAPNCTHLHRQPCAAVSGQCGVCLTGYVGDNGDKSSSCHNFDASFNKSGSVDCVTDSNCLAYQFCDVATRKCLSPPKSCDRNCSQHGSCFYVSVITGAPVTSRCVVDDTRCEAVCSCDVGYSGAACEMDLVSLKLRRNARSILVESLSNLTRLEDVNVQSLNAWSASLFAIVLNPHELSIKDAQLAVQIANNTIRHAVALQLDSYAEFAGVLQASDALASLQQYNYNPNEYDHLSDTSTSFATNSAGDIVQVVGAFAELVEMSMEVGQSSQLFHYNNFRVEVSKRTILASRAVAREQDAFNFSVRSPRTEFEIAVNNPYSTATFVSAALTTTVTVGVKSLLIFPRSYAQNIANFLSSPMYLQLSAQSGSAQSPDAYISGVKFEFPFTEADGRFATLPLVQNVTTTCSAERMPGRPGGFKVVEHQYTCADSGTVIHHNCTGIRGILTSYCPVLAPACGSLDISSAGITYAADCAILRYNSTFTSCYCSLGDSGSRSQQSVHARRLATTGAFIAANGVSNMIASPAFVAANTSDSFEPVDLLIAEDSMEHPDVVVILISTLWGAGVLVMLFFCYGSYRYQSMTAKSAKFKLETFDDTLLQSHIEEGSNMQHANELLSAYVASTIPTVFRTGLTEYQTIAAELVHHHRYFSAFVPLGRADSLWRRGVLLLRVLTDCTFVLFFLALFYAWQSPEHDNNCDSLASEGSCLQNRRLFDYGQSICTWDYNADVFKYECTFKEKYTEVTGFVYIFVLIVTFLAAASVPLDLLFCILLAPLLSDAPPSGASAEEASESASAEASPRPPGTQYVRQTVDGRSTWISRVNSGVALTRSLSGKIVSGAGREANVEQYVLSEEIQNTRERIKSVSSHVITRAAVLQEQCREKETILRDTAQRLRSRRHAVMVAGEATDDFLSQLNTAPAPGEVLRSNDTLDGKVGKFNLTQQTDATLQALSDDLLNQRYLMQPNTAVTKEFDALWGVQAKAPTAASITLAEEKFQIDPACKAAIKTEVRFVEHSLHERKAAFLTTSDQQSGLQLLHLFVVELLGRRTEAALIFRNKMDRDFGRKRPISADLKALCALVIIALNAFFIYYVLWIASSKGHIWQTSYLVAFVVQVCAQVVLTETAECVGLNVVIPRLVLPEVQAAWKIVTQLVDDLNTSTVDPSAESGGNSTLYFSAPQFMFVSHKLAQCRPSLVESALVLCYRNPLPGHLAPGRSAGIRIDEQLTMKFHADELGNAVVALYWVPWYRIGSILLYLHVVLVGTLRSIGTQPLIDQRVLLRSLQCILLSGLLLFCLAATFNTAALAILVALLAIAASMVCWRCYYQYRYLALQSIKVAPALEIGATADANSANTAHNLGTENSVTKLDEGQEDVHLTGAPDDSSSSEGSFTADEMETQDSAVPRRPTAFITPAQEPTAVSAHINTVDNARKDDSVAVARVILGILHLAGDLVDDGISTASSKIASLSPAVHEEVHEEVHKEVFEQVLSEWHRERTETMRLTLRSIMQDGWETDSALESATSEEGSDADAQQSQGDSEIEHHSDVSEDDHNYVMHEDEGVAQYGVSAQFDVHCHNMVDTFINAASLRASTQLPTAVAAEHVPYHSPPMQNQQTPPSECAEAPQQAQLERAGEVIHEAATGTAAMLFTEDVLNQAVSSAELRPPQEEDICNAHEKSTPEERQGVASYTDRLLTGAVSSVSAKHKVGRGAAAYAGSILHKAVASVSGKYSKVAAASIEGAESSNPAEQYASTLLSGAVASVSAKQRARHRRSTTQQETPASNSIAWVEQPTEFHPPDKYATAPSRLSLSSSDAGDSIYTHAKTVHIVDSYEVNSSIFSSDNENDAEWDANHTKAAHIVDTYEVNSSIFSSDGSQQSDEHGDYKTLQDFAEYEAFLAAQGKEEMQHLSTKRVVDTYEVNSSIFSSEDGFT